MVDKVKPLKIENSVDGTQEDFRPTEANPTEDYLTGKGFSFENSDGHLIDRNVSGELQVTDSFFTVPKTIRSIWELLQTHAARHLPSGADPLTTAVAAALSAITSNTEGIANSFSRSDHTHSIATGNVSTQNADQTNAEGTSSNLARADHIHNIPTATPVDTANTNTQGTANTFAKSDHVHKTVISSDSIRSVTSASTTSLTDVLLLGITPTAGTYMAIFDASTYNNINNAQMTHSIYLGGTQVANTEVTSPSTPKNSTIPYHMSFQVTVNGTQELAIYWRTDTGTITSVSRSISLIRLS